MDQKGSLVGFLLCKLAMTFAIIILFGGGVMMYLSFERAAQREKLEVVVRTVADTLREIDSIPGKVWIKREIPPLDKEFELLVIGTISGDQIIRIVAIGSENVERRVVLSNHVNSGEFTLKYKNPVKISLAKDERILLEMF